MALDAHGHRHWSIRWAPTAVRQSDAQSHNSPDSSIGCATCSIPPHFPYQRSCNRLMVKHEEVLCWFRRVACLAASLISDLYVAKAWLISHCMRKKYSVCHAVHNPTLYGVFCRQDLIHRAVLLHDIRAH